MKKFIGISLMCMVSMLFVGTAIAHQSATFSDVSAPVLVEGQKLSVSGTMTFDNDYQWGAIYYEVYKGSGFVTDAWIAQDSWLQRVAGTPYSFSQEFNITAAGDYTITLQAIAKAYDGSIHQSGASDVVVATSILTPIEALEARVSAIEAKLAAGVGLDKNAVNALIDKALNLDPLTGKDDIDLIIGAYNGHIHDKGSGGRNTSTPAPQIQ